MMYRYGGGPGYGMMGASGWLWMVLWSFFGLLVLAGIVLLVVWAVRAGSGPGHSAAGQGAPPSSAAHDEAVAIAKRRFASGEITKDQYEEIVRALGG